MRNILNLPKWTVIKAEEESRAYHSPARFDVPSSACHSCSRFGYLRLSLRRAHVQHWPVRAATTGLHIERQSEEVRHP